MALGDLEKNYLQKIAALHDQMVVASENYLKGSDNASRPSDLVSLATETIQSGTWQSGRMSEMADMLENPPSNSADKVAARLKQDYGY